MSFWGKLGAIGVGALAAVPGLQAFAPELIGAAASIFTGDMAADASHKAANTQIAAGDKALAQNKQMYDDANARQAAVYADNRALFAPFVNVGSNAAGSLGNLLNLPAGGPMSTTPPAGAMPGGGVTPPPGGYMVDAQGRPTPIMAGGGRLLDEPAAAQAKTASGYGALGGVGGQVLMAAPDGSKRAIPRDQVDIWKRRGAREVEA